MKVFVEIHSGSPFELEVCFWDTVLDIKEKIEKYKGIPVSEQILFLQGKILQDDFYVEQCVITHNSLLKLFIFPDFNLIQNNDQVLQTDQSPFRSIGDSSLTVGNNNNNNNSQVFQTDQTPLPSNSTEEFFSSIQDSPATVGSNKNNNDQVLHRTKQSPVPSISIEEFLNFQDSSRKIKSDQVFHQTEQTPVPSNSIGDIRYGEDVPLTTELLSNSNIQNWPETTEEIINNQDSQRMMMGRNNNLVLQTQQSPPLNTAEEIINKQDLLVTVGSNKNNSQVLQTEKTPPSNSVRRSKKPPQKLRVLILPYSREIKAMRKFPVDVNASENVEELRKELVKIQELDLPDKGYFFTHKRRVLDDHQSFRWNGVAHGDTIEIFPGYIC